MTIVKQSFIPHPLVAPMPIPVVCASCQAKLVAPDAAAGKRVKCKKCEAVIVVPTPAVEEASDFEFVEPAVPAKPAIRVAKPVADRDDEAVPKKKSKSKVIVEEGADDEDDGQAPRKAKRKFKAPLIVDEEEDDAPRTPQRATKAEMNPLVLAGLGGAGLFAVIAVGVAVWFIAIRDDKAAATNATPAVRQPSSNGPTPTDAPTPPPKAAIPAGWTKHEMTGCTVCFKDSFGKLIATKSKPGDKTDFDKLHIGVISETTKLMSAFYIQHSPESYPKAVQDIEKTPVIATDESAMGEVTSETKTTIDGQDAREFRVQFVGGKVAFVRQVSAYNRIYIFSVSESNLTEQSETYRAFFDNIKLKP